MNFFLFSILSAWILKLTLISLFTQGIDAAIKGQLPWGGGIREEDFTIPKSCTKKGKGKH